MITALSLPGWARPFAGEVHSEDLHLSGECRGQQRHRNRQVEYPYGRATLLNHGRTGTSLPKTVDLVASTKKAMHLQLDAENITGLVPHCLRDKSVDSWSTTSGPDRSESEASFGRGKPASSTSLTAMGISPSRCTTASRALQPGSLHESPS